MFVGIKNIFRFCHIEVVITVALSIILICILPSILHAATIVSGKVAGHWISEESPYIVENTIWVDYEDSLQIHDGVEVLFMANDSLIVYGTLITDVSLTRRVVFAKHESNNGTWGGIHFKDFASSGSILQYAIILDAIVGVNCFISNPRIEYNYIEPINYGIKCLVSNPSIVGDTVYVSPTNLVPSICFGIYVHSAPERTYIKDCYIDIFINNNDLLISAYGIRCIGSQVNLKRNIVHVGAKNNVLGIFLESSSKDTVEYNEVVVHSTAGHVPAGLYMYQCVSGHATNNTIKVGGEYKDWGIAITSCQNVKLMNNIVAGDGFSVGILVDDPLTVQVEFNDFFQHSTASQGIVLNSTNMEQDPQFLGIEPDSVYQLSEYSPCIDRGNPDPFYNDPDLTRNDMGAYYHHQYPTAVDNGDLIVGNYSLLSCYPNPTNNSCSIFYNLAQGGDIDLSLFNTTGRKISQIKSGFVEAGDYTLNFDFGDLSSGIYFFLLKTQSEVLSEKLILIK